MATIDPFDINAVRRALAEAEEKGLDAVPLQAVELDAREEQDTAVRLGLENIHHQRARAERTPIISEIVEALEERITFAYIDKTKTLHTYSKEDGTFQPDGEKSIRRYVTEVFKDVSVHDIRETIYKIESLHPVDLPDFDNEPEYLHVKNGWINVFTGDIEEHSPARLSLNKLPVEYRKDAECPEIMKFLESTLEPELVDTILKAIGYSLLKDCRFEKAFMCVGEGSNGKSTLFSMISAFFGEGLTANQPLQELTNNRFKKAELFGKMVNVFADLDDTKLLATGTFKMLVSGDNIDAERKHSQPFNFKNYAKQWYSANSIPKTSDDSYAYFRRWLIIPFNKTFDGENRDENLLKKITTPQELSGLLNLALKKLHELIEEHGFGDTNIEEIRKQYELGASKIGDFLEEHCDIETSKEVKASDLHSALSDYCKEKGANYIDNRELGKKLSSLGIKHIQRRVKGGRTWFYLGISLKCLNVTMKNQITFPTSDSENKVCEQDHCDTVTTEPKGSSGDQ